MAVYPQIKIEVKINNAWIPLTSSIVGSQEVEYGFSGNDPTDKIASTGTFRFALINLDNKYTPGHPSCLSGWKKGLPVRLIITYKEDYIKFSGWIDEINLDTKNNKVNVLCTDWIDLASKHTLQSPDMVFDKRIDEMARTIVGSMPIKPDYAIYNQGRNTFPTGFDTVNQKTNALSEFNKLVLSEWGKVYLKNYRLAPSTLIIEGKNTTANKTPTQVPTWDSFYLLENGTGNLLLEEGTKFCWESYEDVGNPYYVATSEYSRIRKEDSGFYLLEDGSILLLESWEEQNVSNTMMRTDFSYGKNIINRSVVTYYPKTVDSTTQVLYSLSDPIYIKAYETMTIVGTYSDPSGDSSTIKTAGKSMINPVASTDYLMGEYFGGGGFADLTMNFTVTANFDDPTQVVFTITNKQNIPTYIQKLQARGIGVYFKDSEIVTIEDSTSINTYADQETDIEMKYSDNQSSASAVAQVLVDTNKNPLTTVNSMEFLANTHDKLMRTFIYIEPGDLVSIEDTKSAIDSLFWVTGIKFTIRQGGIIHFEWALQEALLNKNGVYWELGISSLGFSSRLYF